MAKSSEAKSARGLRKSIRTSTLGALDFEPSKEPRGGRPPGPV
jgi:hypothetical protein